MNGGNGVLLPSFFVLSRQGEIVDMHTYRNMRVCWVSREKLKLRKVDKSL